MTGTQGQLGEQVGLLAVVQVGALVGEQYRVDPSPVPRPMPRTRSMWGAARPCDSGLLTDQRAQVLCHCTRTSAATLGLCLMAF
jgi:hypothetical protein